MSTVSKTHKLHDVNVVVCKNLCLILDYYILTFLVAGYFFDLLHHATIQLAIISVTGWVCSIYVFSIIIMTCNINNVTHIAKDHRPAFEGLYVVLCAIFYMF